MVRQQISQGLNVNFNTYANFNSTNRLYFKYDTGVDVIETPFISITGASIINNFTGVTLPVSSQFVNVASSQHCLSFLATGNTNSLTAGTCEFSLGVYRYNSLLSAFTTTPTILEDITFNTAFTYTKCIDQFQLEVDSDYLVQVYSSCSSDTTCGAIVLEDYTSRTNNGTSITSNPSLDSLFVSYRPALKPEILIDRQTIPQDGFLVNEVISTSSAPLTGQTLFTTSFLPNGAITIGVNGQTLSEGIDVLQNSATTNVFEIFNGATSSDTVTAVYIKTGGTSNFLNEVYQINSPLPTGRTGTNFVYINDLGLTLYEIDLSLISSNVENSEIFINGQRLTPNVDYFAVGSNQSIAAIVSGASLTLGDTINIFYIDTNSQLNINNFAVFDIGTFLTPDPLITWILEPAPKAWENGNFKFQAALVSDTGYTNPVNQQIIPYISDVTTYQTNFPTSGSGQFYRLRVINEKSFTSNFVQFSSATSGFSTEILGNTDDPSRFL